MFFDEFAGVLNCLSTYSEPSVLSGSVNIDMKLTQEPSIVEFNNLLTCRGLVQRVDGITHDAGGTIDIVCTRDDLPAPSVDIVDICISDHRLLSWNMQLNRPPSVYSTVTRRT